MYDLKVCMCPLTRNSYVKILIPKVIGLRGGGLQKWLDHESRTLIKGTMAFIKRDPRGQARESVGEHFPNMYKALIQSLAPERREEDRQRQRETSREFTFAFCHGRAQWEVTSMNFKRPSPDSEFDSKLILDFSVSGTDKFSLLKCL